MNRLLACSVLLLPMFVQAKDEHKASKPKDARIKISTNSENYLNPGFRVPAQIIVLRSQALDLDEKIALEAIDSLSQESMDRVTTELLKSLARNRDQKRRNAAATALVTIGERATKLGFQEFAGAVGEDIYLSASQPDARKRAYPLFMLLDTERARRHRKSEE